VVPLLVLLQCVDVFADFATELTGARLALEVACLHVLPNVGAAVGGGVGAGGAAVHLPPAGVQRLIDFIINVL
jgi:hypothetical protein